MVICGGGTKGTLTAEPLVRLPADLEPLLAAERVAGRPTLSTVPSGLFIVMLVVDGGVADLYSVDVDFGQRPCER